MDTHIRPVQPSDSEWILDIVRSWGADFVISRARVIYPSRIDGFYAVDDQAKRLGLVTYEIIDDQCEIVTLDAFEKYQGIGTKLLDTVVHDATLRGCRRLWLITTNDNLDAMRFYQRRGLAIAAVYAGALDTSRKLKPSIPLVGNYGIPMRDEIEFELVLHSPEDDAAPMA
jgi:N-acetylglutamate synthase-like GNAT family acetyltransferase